MHRFLITFRLPFLATLLFSALCTIPQAYAQTPTTVLSEWLESHRIGHHFEPVEQLLSPQADQYPEHRPAIEGATLLHLNADALHTLLEAEYPAMRLRLPNAHGTDFDLELVQVDILSDGFMVGTLGTEARASVEYSPGLHYRGIIRGNPHSIAAVSLTTDGLAAMICDDTGTYTAGRMEDGSADYLLYRREDLPTSAPHTCFAEEVQTPHDLPTTVGERGVGCRTVQIYFECDYKMYTDKGSTTAGVTNYVTSLFNQIAALYAAENVSVAISEIYVWTSPDPYQSLTSTSNVLNAFRANRGTNFNGNLAHFLSTRNLGGGIAYVDVICAKSYAFGVSGISTSFQNVPTYSWSVEVVTHELGHNLGSWHTQSCNWPGGAIDNCVQPEGSCPPGPPPTNGGTIMSYCHLSGYGINFNNGFGTLPGNKIRERVTAATCAPQSGTAPTNLNSTNIAATSATVQWGAVTGATTYTVQYKTAAAATWTTSGAIPATSLVLNNLTANTAYQWQVKTDCSAWSPAANFSTTAAGGGGTCVAPGSLSSSGLTASSATLAWAAVSGATGYTVQYKTVAATTWTTAGNPSSPTLWLSNLTASTSYQWQVKANCSTWSATASFSTSASGGSCLSPTGLGTNSITTTSATLTWAAASGASNYQVQYKASTSAIWIQTALSPGLSRTLSSLSPNTAYQWQVKSNCSAWSGISNFNTLSTGSGTCNAPAGPNTANITASSATLRWTAVSGATTYTVQFKTAASSFWSTAGSTNGVSYAVSGLAASTAYQWRVKANCSTYTATVTFTTSTGNGGGGLQCDVPGNLLNNSIGATWAVISWGASPGATSYTIQIKLPTETTYTTLGTVGSRQVTLSGMQPSTTYQWRVKANCSAYSNPLTLTTAANTSDPGTGQLPQIAALNLFPNPASDAVQVRFSGSLMPDAELWLTDVTGRVLSRQRMLLDQQQLDVSALPGGVYFVSLRQGGQAVQVEHLLKL